MKESTATGTGRKYLHVLTTNCPKTGLRANIPWGSVVVNQYPNELSYVCTCGCKEVHRFRKSGRSWELKEEEGDR